MKINHVFVNGTLKRGMGNRPVNRPHHNRPEPGKVSGLLYHLPYNYPTIIGGKGEDQGEANETRLAWKELLRRYGFKVEGNTAELLDLRDETEQNLKFLSKLLSKFSLADMLNMITRIFTPPIPDFSEKAFVDAYYRLQGNSEGGQADDLRNLEPHVAALVRTFKELGLRSSLSCEGHIHQRSGRAIPYICFLTSLETKAAAAIMDIAFRAGENKLICRDDNRYLKIQHSNLFNYRIRELNRQQRQVILWNNLLDTVHLLQEKEAQFRNMLPQLKEILE